MSQYICPKCGSRFLQLITDEGSTIFTLNSGYLVNVLQDDSGIPVNEIEGTTSIHCGACSWHGEITGLQESDLLA